MRKKNILNKGVSLLLPILIAVAGTYSYPLMSLLMPLLALLLIYERRGKLSFHLSPPFVFLFLLLILGGAGVFWAKCPDAAIKIFATTSLTLGFSYLFISLAQELTLEQCAKYHLILKRAGVVLISLVLLQYVLEGLGVRLFDKLGEGYMMKPTASIIGLGAFMGCALLWVYNNKILSGVTFILFCLLTYITRNETACYGMVLAIGVFIVSYLAPFWATRIALVSSYTCLILTPFIFIQFSTFFKVKWVFQHLTFFHRVIGWSFLSEKFLESPWLGWGLGATPYLPEEAFLAQGLPYLMHPHKSSLQAYLELGIGGGILFALFFASLFWMVEKYLKDRLSIAVCNATISFAFIQAEITHSLWHNHWISWVAFLTGVLMIFLKVRAAQLHVRVDH